MTLLKGITWDHPRGYAPLEALGPVDGIEVQWDRRSLREFGDTPVGELAERYDLMIIDHPHIGMAAEGLRPLESEPFGTGDSLSSRSYCWQGQRLAFPVDAACQVGAWRRDLLPEFTPPRTWAEAEAFATELRTHGQWMAMALCPTDSLCSFLTLAAQGGTPPHERTWMPDDAVAEGLDRLRRLRAVCHPESTNWNPIDLYERMCSGEDIVYSPLGFGYTDYQRTGTLCFGGIPGRTHALLGGAGIAVSSRTSYPREAEHIACVLAGKDYQTGGYLRFGGQPGHALAWDVEAGEDPTGGFLSGTRTTLQQAWMRPREPEWPRFQEELGERVWEYLVKGVSTHTTVASLKTLHRTHFQA